MRLFSWHKTTGFLRLNLWIWSWQTPQTCVLTAQKISNKSVQFSMFFAEHFPCNSPLKISKTKNKLWIKICHRPESNRRHEHCRVGQQDIALPVELLWLFIVRLLNLNKLLNIFNYELCLFNQFIYFSWSDDIRYFASCIACVIILIILSYGLNPFISLKLLVFNS